MVIASAKSQSMRGASHQPALMVSFLTIGHTCLPCLPSGMVSHCFLVLLKWEVPAILGNGCEVQGQNYVAISREVKCWWEVGDVGQVER